MQMKKFCIIFWHFAIVTVFLENLGMRFMSEFNYQTFLWFSNYMENISNVFLISI